MKKVVWLIQSSGINVSQPQLIIETLDKLGFEYKDFGLIPFTNEITNLENILEPDTKYIIKGGTKLLTILDNINNVSELCPYLSKEQIENSDNYLKALKNAIFYDVQKFDQNYYKDFNLPLLNQKAEYLQVNDILNTKFDKDVFIKPSRDLKAFNGGILEKGITVKEYIENGFHQMFYQEETIILSDFKKIYSEYRFFVVNKEVITGSQYRRGDNKYLSRDIEENVLSIAKEYALLYQPFDIFTMDICETDEGFKIIEYNCWNASGLYHSDVLKIFFEVNEFIKN